MNLSPRFATPFFSVAAILGLALLFNAAPAAAASNKPPVISGTPPTSVTVGSVYYFRPTASDPDGDKIWFKIVNKPKWASFDSVTGTLTGTPTTGDIGVYPTIKLRVTDGTNTRGLPMFAIKVLAATSETTVNHAPTISGTPATTATTGVAYVFQPTAADPDGDTLRYTIANKPTWASFSSSTGRLAGTPSSSYAGITFSNITISASDGATKASLPPFSITVTTGNRAPVISGTPATSVSVGQAYAFQPSASDPDGNTLTYSIVNRPSWATFSSSTGRLTGTPSSSVAGMTFSNIAISVSDGTLKASLAPFSVTVTTGNRTPVISGTPATSAAVGQAYAFQPSASDPDGNTLTYSIVNRPSWATFSTSTGRLTGTPGSSVAGMTFGGITISVSDGTASASLAPFSISIAQSVSGSATLSWQPPTTNTDGSPLTNLSGYRVSYGMASRQYNQTLSLPNAALTSVVVENLSSGTWYFSVKALTSTGAESDFSAEASKTIP